MMKKLITVALILASTTVLASDKTQNTFRSKDGNQCSSQVALPELKLSLEGGFENQDGDTSLSSSSSAFNRGNDGRVTLTYTVPLTSSADSLDCDLLYQIELEKARLELEQLKMSIDQQRKALWKAEAAAKNGTATATGEIVPSFDDVEPTSLFSSEEKVEENNAPKVNIRELINAQ